MTQSEGIPLVPERDRHLNIQKGSHTQLDFTTPEKKVSTANISAQHQVHGEYRVQTKGQLIVNFSFILVTFISIFGSVLTQNPLLLILLPISIVSLIYYNWKLKNTDQTSVIQPVRESINEFYQEHMTQDTILQIICCLLFVFAVPIFIFFGTLFNVLLTGELPERIIAFGLLIVSILSVRFLIMKIRSIDGKSE